MTTPASNRSANTAGRQRDEIDIYLATVRRLAQQDSDDDEELNAFRIKKKKPFPEWPSFQTVVGLVIALNAITIGIQIDQGDSNGQTSQLWYIIEFAFMLFFLSEVLVRIAFHKLNFFIGVGCISNVFDFAIVLGSVVDVLILMPLGNGGGGRIVTLVRFFRLLRLARLIRLFKIFKELYLVAAGLINSLRTVGWVCLVIFVFCYCCSIFLTIWVGQNDELYGPYFIDSGGWDQRRYFRNVWRSTLTLFQIATLDTWNDEVVRHVVQNQPALLIFFVLFLLFTTFGLMNIILGVVVENTVRTSNKNQAQLKRKQEQDRIVIFNNLREIFEMADQDGSGTLTIEEVSEAVQKPEIYNKLKSVEFPVDDPSEIFTILDFDGTGELSIDEFITGCIRMRGSARGKDLLVAQLSLDNMKKHCEVLEKELRKFEGKVEKLTIAGKALMGQGANVFLDARQIRELQNGAKLTADSVTHQNLPWES